MDVGDGLAWLPPTTGLAVGAVMNRLSPTASPPTPRVARLVTATGDSIKER